MAKIKLTINELKQQKDALARYRRFLPNLILKKQYIQIELTKVREDLDEKRVREKKLIEAINQWIAVMGEEVGLAGLIEIDVIDIQEGNIAGVDIPVFKGVRFKDIPYDLYATPLWIDTAIAEIKRILAVRAEILVLEEQRARLEAELLTTTQRVNLFEKVKIPDALENIRIIQIFLGDQQTAAVARSKIAKAKMRRDR